ncbi:MAG TPA: hypothetical protein VFX89_01630 [Gammaproteobacteria bacterium]|nr:hypothetical protein [Gammaproteobacteria bacterium]
MKDARFLGRLALRCLPALVLASGLAACDGGERQPAATTVAAPTAPAEPLRYDAEYPTMRYGTAARTDPVAKLAERLARGELKLERGPRGYLDSLLAALHIDPASQTLVFSQTSLQSKRIRPEKPRAIYFNDEVYVAWVQEGPLEIGSMDPNLGPVFYMVEQDAPKARFDHELNRCLSCHDSYSLSGGGVPRFIVGSGYIGPSGNLVSHEGWILVTDQTPLKSRWGGWYVTGHHGKQVHLGNVLIRSLDDFQRLEQLRVGNIDNVDALFDTKPYLTNESDIVALLVLEHQVNAQNAIARVNWDVRTAIDKEPARAAGSGYSLPAAELSPATMQVVRESVEPLVQTMLFAGETKLTDEISGDPKFAAQFASRAVRDAQGRSLRDLDLHTRVFRYPLSYLVYSPAFDALPRAAREAVYARFAAVLRGEDRSEPFARLVDADRAAILEILTATKPEFAAALR